MEYSATAAAAAATDKEQTIYSRWTSYLSSRRGATSNNGGGRRSYGGRSASGTHDGIRVAGGPGGQRRHADNAAQNTGTKSAKKQSAPGSSTNSSSSSKKNKSKPNGPGAGPPASLFDQHHLGLPELSHGNGGPLHGALIGGKNAAATPEPATFLLLGTGLVATAGMMRRRLR
jgi:hypothetical protein